MAEEIVLSGHENTQCILSDNWWQVVISNDKLIQDYTQKNLLRTSNNILGVTLEGIRRSYVNNLARTSGFYIAIS